MYKRYGKDAFLLDENDTDEIVEECIIGDIDPPSIKQKSDKLLYYFDTSHLNIKVE